jgi:hypothetical protein
VRELAAAGAGGVSAPAVGLGLGAGKLRLDVQILREGGAILDEAEACLRLRPISALIELLDCAQLVPIPFNF